MNFIKSNFQYVISIKSFVFSENGECYSIVILCIRYANIKIVLTVDHVKYFTVSNVVP